MPDRTVTARLVLRRPSPADLDAVFTVHADPRTNTHNPAGPDPDRAASARRLSEWLDHWEDHGFGCWTVEDAGPAGATVGFAGLRHSEWRDRPVLNLYYRFSPERWGRGLATEAARAAVTWARAALPDLPVLAMTTERNLASQRTALAAGLERRPELEQLHHGLHAVILVAGWDAARWRDG